jgi:uncharacterized membrane protein
MSNRLSLLLDALRGSFWFLPTLLSLGAGALAIGLVALDVWVTGSTLRGVRWIYTGGAEGARSLLSTVAGAVVTVVGVAFSVTIVSLQLASAQLGPRVLRNFMRDRGNQAVLGTFVATFVYCLLVLRTVRGGDGLDDDPFIPHLAITGGVVLAIVSAAVLIYFIHHAAVSIQADHVIATIASELEDTVDLLYPERLGDDEPASGPAPALPDDFERRARIVRARGSGYVQSVDAPAVLGLATARDLVVRLECRPGDFVAEGEPVARAWPVERVEDETARRLASAVVLGRVRTLMQDFGFGVEQLVEIAIRALSSDLRDPTTAMRCIDRLGAAIARLAGRRIPSPFRRDGDRLRVIAPGVSLSEVVHEAFDPIRERGMRSLAVMLRLLETFERLARLRPSRELHAALLRETVKVERSSRAALSEPWERRAIELHAAAVRRAVHPEVLTEAETVTLSRPA